MAVSGSPGEVQRGDPGHAAQWDVSLHLPLTTPTSRHQQTQDVTSLVVAPEPPALSKGMRAQPALGFPGEQGGRKESACIFPEFLTRKSSRINCCWKSGSFCGAQGTAHSPQRACPVS